MIIRYFIKLIRNCWRLLFKEMGHHSLGCIVS